MELPIEWGNEELYDNFEIFLKKYNFNGKWKKILAFVSFPPILNMKGVLISHKIVESKWGAPYSESKKSPPSPSYSNMFKLFDHFTLFMK